MDWQADALLARLCAELQAQHQAHTILLYGSRANGSEGPGSDYDIAAFAPVARTVHDARLVDGEYLDAFIYPEAVLETPHEEHLRLLGSVVVLQRGTLATDFLTKLQSLHDQGPPPLANDEVETRIAWAWKMLERTRRGDVEGDFRRVWLLTTLLEDYFQLRGAWYRGPKRALQWLALNDAATYSAFCDALRPEVTHACIEDLVARVVGLAKT